MILDDDEQAFDAELSCRCWKSPGQSHGMAAQLMATNLPSRRALCLWMARAISSLPVPLSPRIKHRHLRRARPSRSCGGL